MAKQQILPAFVTPIWSCVWDDCAEVNAGLKRIILERAPAEAQTHRSNMGGWHSEQDVLKWGGAEVGQLVEWMKMGINFVTQATKGIEEAATGEFFIVAWANVLYQGGSSTGPQPQQLCLVGGLLRGYRRRDAGA